MRPNMVKYGIRFHIALFFLFIIPYYLLLPYLTQRYDLWQITAGLSTITIILVGMSYFGSPHEKKGLMFELFSFLRFSLKTIGYIGVVTWVGINYKIEFFTVVAMIYHFYSTHVGALLISIILGLFIIASILGDDSSGTARQEEETRHYNQYGEYTGSSYREKK